MRGFMRSLATLDGAARCRPQIRTDRRIGGSVLHQNPTLLVSDYHDGYFSLDMHAVDPS
jgi:hypothetical protein